MESEAQNTPISAATGLEMPSSRLRMGRERDLAALILTS